ncbi:MAG: hypothetical protein AMJ93_05595 [Anaerolineae bacterium SM23_84]|nr:MAG: hypothetical protein AMJ93_05595 [Anaerolineae bacterium SM23_84]
MSIEIDTVSIEAIISALYDTISHKPGKLPDWQRMKPLFIDGARIIAPSLEGSPIQVMTFQEFAERVSESVHRAGDADRGFDERELANRTEVFGNMAHVWSTYESRYTTEDQEPFSRGINSFQLLYHSGRWWVVTILWDIERPGNPIPERYLP